MSNKIFNEMKKLKGSKEINTYKDAYDIVETKLAKAIEPNMSEIRKWFIYKVEKIYDTKMLGTETVYCYNTFNKLKEKYKFNNVALAAKLDVWLIKYKQLGYEGIFDFSKLNTDWILYNLDANIAANNKNKTTYQDKNVNLINTKDRRI